MAGFIRKNWTKQQDYTHLRAQSIKLIFVKHFLLLWKCLKFICFESKELFTVLWRIWWEELLKNACNQDLWHKTTRCWFYIICICACHCTVYVPTLPFLRPTNSLYPPSPSITINRMTIVATLPTKYNITRGQRMLPCICHHHDTYLNTIFI